MSYQEMVRPAVTTSIPAILVGLRARVPPCCWFSECTQMGGVLDLAPHDQEEFAYEAYDVRVVDQGNGKFALTYADTKKLASNWMSQDQESSDSWRAFLAQLPENVLVLEFENMSLDLAYHLGFKEGFRLSMEDWGDKSVRKQWRLAPPKEE